MSKGYTKEYIEQAETMILAAFRELCGYDYAKFTVNMNRRRCDIEIVKEPHEVVRVEKSS